MTLPGVKFGEATDWAIEDADVYDRATLISEELGTEAKLARSVEKQHGQAPLFSSDFHYSAELQVVGYVAVTTKLGIAVDAFVKKSKSADFASGSYVENNLALVPAASA